MIDARIAEFWSWFARHEAELAKAFTAVRPVLDELLQQLQRIDPHLDFEISTNSEPHELIVTAEGRRELSPLVDATIAAAPQLEGWAFVPLKPAMGFAFQTSYERSSLDPRTMWFLSLESPSKPTVLGLRIRVPDIHRSREQSAKNAVHVILDTALGERAAASDIQHIEVVTLPPEPESKGYIELEELGDYIEWRKKRLADRGRSPSA